LVHKTKLFTNLIQFYDSYRAYFLDSSYPDFIFWASARPTDSRSGGGALSHSGTHAAQKYTVLLPCANFLPQSTALGVRQKDFPGHTGTGGRSNR
jgi:hypothetical protein